MKTLIVLFVSGFAIAAQAYDLGAQIGEREVHIEIGGDHSLCITKEVLYENGVVSYRKNGDKASEMIRGPITKKLGVILPNGEVVLDEQ